MQQHQPTPAGVPACNNLALQPSSPGYGYLILPFPQLATFKPVGEHFVVSFLPEILYSANVETIKTLTVCLWLGPEDNQPDTMVFLIWPGQGIISFGEIFTKKQRSFVMHMKDAPEFMPDATNRIARDLLHVNRSPCLFFVRQWDETIEANTAVDSEANELCLMHICLDMVGSLRSEMEKRVEPTGDAVKSSCFQEWLSIIYDKLRSCKPSDYFMDPTVLAAGLMAHLLAYILEHNKLDLGRKPMVYVPMDFVRAWAAAVEGVSLDYTQMSTYLRTLFNL